MFCNCRDLTADWTDGGNRALQEQVQAETQLLGRPRRPVLCCWCVRLGDRIHGHWTVHNCFARAEAPPGAGSFPEGSDGDVHTVRFPSPIPAPSDHCSSEGEPRGPGQAGPGPTPGVFFSYLEPQVIGYSVEGGKGLLGVQENVSMHMGTELRGWQRIP